MSALHFLEFGTERTTYVGRIAQELDGRPVATHSRPYDRIETDSLRLGNSVLRDILGRRHRAASVAAKHAKPFELPGHYLELFDDEEAARLQKAEQGRPDRLRHRLRIMPELGERVLRAIENNGHAETQRQQKRTCHTFAHQLATGESVSYQDGLDEAKAIITEGVDVTFLSDQELREIPQGTRLVFAGEQRTQQETMTLPEPWHSGVTLGPNSEVISLRVAGSTCVGYDSISDTRRNLAMSQRVDLDWVRVYMEQEAFNAFWYPTAPDPQLT